MRTADFARAPVAAVAFLTRIPVGRALALDGQDVARAAPLFPLVGGGVGLVSGLLASALVDPIPALAAGAVGVGTAAILTGALHLDALADTADALGATSRERALEIMRDHSTGAFGATALIVVVLLDAALLGALAAAGDAPLVALAAGAAGRAVMVPLAAVLPYAREGGGAGRALADVGPARAALALAVAFLLALPMGVAGLAALGAAAGVALALGVFFARWLGGVTGDALGATAKLGETAALLAAAAVVL